MNTLPLITLGETVLLKHSARFHPVKVVGIDIAKGLVEVSCPILTQGTPYRAFFDGRSWRFKDVFLFNRDQSKAKITAGIC